MLIRSNYRKVPEDLVRPDLVGFELNANSYIPNPIVVEQTPLRFQYDIFCHDAFFDMTLSG